MLPPVTIKLSRPIDVIDQHFEEIRVREPTGEDLMAAADATGIALLMKVGASCANLPIDALKKMPACDVLAVTKAVSDFLEGPPPAGSATSISSAPAGGATPSSM